MTSGSAFGKFNRKGGLNDIVDPVTAALNRQVGRTVTNVSGRKPEIVKQRRQVPPQPQSILNTTEEDELKKRKTGRNRVVANKINTGRSIL